MINRRILIFGLIVVLGLATIRLGANMFKGKDKADMDKIEVVRSDTDQMDIQIVEDDGMRKTVLYFSDSEGYLVPVMKRIPWEEGIAKSTIRNMTDSSELREVLGSTGLKPLIPMGTNINGISINEETGLCKIDFSEEIQDNESDKDEENLIKGVVYTLTEFSAVKEVQILVGGKMIPVMKHGTAIDKPMSRENINLLGKAEDGRSNVLVYYKGNADADYDYFVPVTIPTLAPSANVYSALDLLFQGPPSGTTLKSDIPTGVNFTAVEIKDGTAFVDINLPENSSLSQDVVLNNIMKNIGLTLSQFEEIETVELLVDGQIINTTIPVFANEY